MADDDGASPKERIVEACRRDNLDLFQEVLSSMKDQPAEKIADFFNNTKDATGKYLLHVCASCGSRDVMDELLNIEYLECDPLTRLDKETPIHTAVRYAVDRDVDVGTEMVEMLVDAGGDPRTKDKHGRSPAQVCDSATRELSDLGKLKALRSWLEGQEYILKEGLEKESHQRRDDDNAPTGSASDSE